MSGRFGAPARRDGPRRVDRLSLVVGVLFVLAGIVFLLDALDVWRLRGDYLVPLGLIVLGLAVLTSGVPLGTRRS
jgi:Na+/phosphate symporter